MNVEVDVITYEYVTEEADPTDSWDRDNTGMDIRYVTVHPTDKEVPEYRSHYSHVFEVPDESDLVYVVIGRYSTGDTFGNDDGQYEVFDVFNTEWQAQELEAKLRATVPSWDRNSKVNTKFEFDYNGKHHYVPWSGYFEHFETVEIYETLVEARK